jgi:hypothetical protein
MACSPKQRFIVILLDQIPFALNAATAFELLSRPLVPSYEICFVASQVLCIAPVTRTIRMLPDVHENSTTSEVKVLVI